MSFSKKIKKEINENIKKNKEDKKIHFDEHRLILSNLFLSNGSITDPNKYYHLEFLFTNEEKATNVLSVLQKYNLKSKIIQRKTNWLVYIKDSESIADFLNIVYAHDSLMEFHNIRISKDISGRVNGEVNLETANLNKTINAAIEQEKDINFLLDNHPEKLTSDLLSIANARLENMDATLVEIADSFEPPLTKSCVNHRMRKIRKLAEKLRK